MKGLNILFLNLMVQPKRLTIPNDIVIILIAVGLIQEIILAITIYGI